MDSPRSGSLNKSVELLRVETNLFNLFIKGKPFHPTVEALHLHRVEDAWVDATLQIVSVPSRLKVEAVHVFSPEEGRLIPYDTQKIRPCFYEHQNYQVIVQQKENAQTLEFYHENAALRQAVEPMGIGLLSGVLNFSNEVGYTDFEIRVAGMTALQVRLEIFPSKLDYKTDYQNLLSEVNEQVYNLAFDFLRKTYNLTGLQQTANQSLTEFFSILQPIFQQLVQAVERIQAAPHHHLEKENRVMVADKVRRAGKENIAYLAKNPHLLVKDSSNGMIRANGQNYRPTKLIETKRRIDFNTVENRFLRFALIRIGAKLKEIRKRLLDAQKRRKEKMDPVLAERLGRIDRMQAQLARLLRFDFLQDVGEMRQMSLTLVLQMAPGYRDVYRFYLMLLKGLSLQGDAYQISMKDVAQLYEYWCFLKIHNLLQKKYVLVRQNMIRVNHGGLFVTLDKSRAAKVTYRNPQTGEYFTLFYNPTRIDGKKLPTVAQRPDNVLTLKKHDADEESGSEKEFKYIFDAKYRINPAYFDTEYQRYYKTPGPEEDDINTMHRYRDALVYQEVGSEFYERSMFGAYVLFPYQDEALFEHHHFYKSIRKVNVGAFPFLPNATTLMERFLDELIADTPDKAFERSVPPRYSSAYYANKFQNSHDGNNETD